MAKALRRARPANVDHSIFATWAPRYRELGFWPRPILPGTKACKIRDWQLSDPEQDPATLQHWLTQYSQCGIGLLMGSPLPDGTRLGAIDIDRDSYVRAARAVLGDPPCWRVGQKGAVLFVRCRGRLRNTEYRVMEGTQRAKIGECLFSEKLCVIPPTIHKDTRKPYRWCGEPLHETRYLDLPIVEE